MGLAPETYRPFESIMGLGLQAPGNFPQRSILAYLIDVVLAYRPHRDPFRFIFKALSKPRHHERHVAAIPFLRLTYSLSHYLVHILAPFRPANSPTQYSRAH